MRHPEVRDVCDIGQLLFWNYRWAWWGTAVMFILNNTFIQVSHARLRCKQSLTELRQGFHCLVGAEWLNTISGHGACTVVFSFVWALLSWVCSLPRTFNTLSKLGACSAVFTFLSVLLAAIFAGAEDHPWGWDPAYPLDVLVSAEKSTTYVMGMNAFLNISYT